MCVLGLLAGGACIAAATWFALPRDRRPPPTAPPPFVVVGIAVLLLCFSTCWYGLLPSPVRGYQLEIFCATLAAPALLVFGMLVALQRRPGISRPAGSALAWSLVAAGIAGLSIATVGVFVLLPLLGITAYAGAHAVTFARVPRTPALDFAMTSTSLGLALFWIALPATHVDLPTGYAAWDAWVGSGATSYMPGSRAGFPFHRIEGGANASAQEFLPMDRGLPWMLLNAACCMALCRVLMWPVPRAALRPLVLPALVASCVATLIGVTYMMSILD